MPDRHPTVRLWARLIGTLLTVALRALMANRPRRPVPWFSRPPTATPEPTLSSQAAARLSGLEILVQERIDTPGTLTDTEVTAILQVIDAWDEEFAHVFCVVTHTGSRSSGPTPCRQWEVQMPSDRRSWSHQDRKTYTAGTSTGEAVSLDFAGPLSRSKVART
jgi:hypothetical protein